MEGLLGDFFFMERRDLFDMSPRREKGNGGVVISETVVSKNHIDHTLRRKTTYHHGLEHIESFLAKVRVRVRARARVRMNESESKSESESESKSESESQDE